MSTSSVSRQPQRTPPFPPAHRGLRAVLVAGLLVVAVPALAGGAAMLRNPLTPLGMTTGLLAGSPFDTYTVPGVLLLVLVGLAPLVLAGALLVRLRGAVLPTAFAGVGLVAWIVVQWWLLPDRLWLQPVVFGVGAAITALAVLAFRRGAR